MVNDLQPPNARWLGVGELNSGFASNFLKTKAASRIRLALVVMIVAALITLGTSTIPTRASSNQMVTIGMPFTGQWAYNAIVNPPYTDTNSSWPGVHQTDGGGDWATDLYQQAGTPVKLWLNNPTGTMALSLRNTWTSSCAGAGSGIAIYVTVGGVNIGWVSYAHLDNINSTGPFVNGMTLGFITNGSLSSCYSARHTHLEVKNTTNYSCWVDNGQPGVTLNEQTAVGVLGSTNTGVKQPCTNVPSSGSNPLRIGALYSNGGYIAKEGSLSSGWVTLSNDSATQIMQNGTLSGMVWNGELLVKQGALTNNWITEASSGVVQASISDAVGSTPIRIGMLKTDGSFWVKEGLTGTWVDEYSGTVTAGAVSGNRIAVLLNSGAFLVKEGDLGSGWVVEYSANVSQGIINGSLIGVVTGSVLLVKQGALDSGWVTENGNVANAQLSDATNSTPVRIGIIYTDGTYQVKESLYGGWVTENGSVSQAALSGNLIGVVINGLLYVKQGSLSAGWVLENGSITQTALWSPN